MKQFWRRYGRWLALAAGAIVLSWLIADAGVASVLAALAMAGAMMPAIVLCDLLFYGGETMAYRVLLDREKAQVPFGVLVRSALGVYPLLVLAPMGRPSAEIARTAALAPYLGAGRAAAAGAHLQAATLMANAVVSIPGALIAAWFLGVTHPLTWLIAGNGAVMGAVALAVLLIARRSRIGRWVGSKIPRLAAMGEDLDRALGRGPGPFASAVAWCVGSRLAQVLQFGLILYGLGAGSGIAQAFLAQAIHLVGAAVGDVVPSQVGIMEGVYRVFSGALDPSLTAARAISIALLSRLSQFIVVAISLVTLACWRPQPIVKREEGPCESW